MNRLTHIGTTGAVLLGLVAAAPAALAQSAWPSKPVKLVVGFSAGGPTDVVARGFAEQAARDLGQPVVVDNKPGANTIIAAEAVATSNDQHTLLVAATNHTMIPALYQNRVKFDALKSFKPICTFAVAPTVLVVGPSMPVKTLAEFVQKAKATPQAVTYGTPGVGSSGHFFSESFARIAGVRMNHIPYKGANQVITDLMGGQVDASFATLGSVLPQLKSGRLTALAISSPNRSAQLPGVPTFEESGIQGYSADSWYGLLAPASLTAPALKTLETASQAYLTAPSTAEKLRALGMEPQATCGAAFGDQLAQEVKLYSQIAQDLGLKAE